jgi:hypothetical protein
MEEWDSAGFGMKGAECRVVAVTGLSRGHVRGWKMWEKDQDRDYE